MKVILDLMPRILKISV